MSKAGVAVVVLLALGLGYCTLHSPPVPKATHAFDLAVEGEPAEPEDRIESDGGEEVRAGETYPEYDARRDALDTGLYSGADECTVDCSGHDAGRQWAEEHGITDPGQCGGKSWSFVEGCRAFAEEKSGAPESGGSREDE